MSGKNTMGYRLQKEILSGILLLGLLFSLTACDVPMRMRYQFNPPASGDLLLSDNFSEKSTWEVWSDTYSVVDYNSGGLRFFVNQPDFVYWSHPGDNFTDVKVVVEAVKISGPDDNSFGVMCRYKNRDNFYYAVISSDGYHGILKVLDGNHALISADQLQFSDVISQGNRQANQLMFECNGPNLALTVNDTRLAVAYDADLSWGSVGLIVGTYEEVGVDILFDDFEVLQP
jgi:hypothetical protein